MGICGNLVYKYTYCNPTLYSSIDIVSGIPAIVTTLHAKCPKVEIVFCQTGTCCVHSRQTKMLQPTPPILLSQGSPSVLSPGYKSPPLQSYVSTSCPLPAPIHFQLMDSQEWQRVGFGPGFCILGSEPRARTCDPDLARLLIRFFSWGLDPSCRARLTAWAQIQPNQKKKKLKPIKIF